MAITYTWKVTSLKTKTLNDTPDVIVQTYWEKIGTDEDGNTASFSGATPFTVDNVPKGTFVPFNELTEEIVLSWIKSVVVGNYEAHVNEQIERQLDKNKPKDKPLPWVPSPQPEEINAAPTISTNTSSVVANSDIVLPNVSIEISNTSSEITSNDSIIVPSNE